MVASHFVNVLSSRNRARIKAGAAPMGEWKGNIHLYDAAGNRVIIIDCEATNYRRPVSLVEFVEDRLSKCKSTFLPEIYCVLNRIGGSFHARFWNPDLSPEDVCANALRCIAAYLKHKEPAGFFEIITPRFVAQVFADSKLAGVSIPLNAIQVSTVESDWLVDPGTPHRVRRTTNIHDSHVRMLGLLWSTGKSPLNATFYSIKDERETIRVRTFERGVGETASCGTGALAAAIAWHQERSKVKNICRTQVEFHSGQQLQIELNLQNNHATISGAFRRIATKCFLPTQREQNRFYDEPLASRKIRSSLRDSTMRFR